MRWVAFVVGLVLAVSGAILWVVPVYTDTETTVGAPQGGSLQGEVVENNPPLVIFTSSITYYAGWTAPANVTVSVYDCGGSSGGCANARHLIATGSGFSGGLTWTGQKGEYYIVVSTGAAQLGVSYGEPLAAGLVGLTLVSLGVLGLLYGAFTGPKLGPTGRPTSPKSARPASAAARPAVSSRAGAPRTPPPRPPLGTRPPTPPSTGPTSHPPPQP